VRCGPWKLHLANNKYVRFDSWNNGATRALGSYRDEIRRRGIRYFVTSSRIHSEITNAVPMRYPSPIEFAADVAIVSYSSREISESVVVEIRGNIFCAI
jgi:hypothetical protein